MADGPKPGHGKRASNFLPFAQARALARSLGFKSRKEYTKNRPENLPSNPAQTYKGEWTSWGDFLGTGNVHTKHFLPFAEARALARSLGFKSREEYAENCPDNLPRVPRGRYKGEWTGWGDFLGTGNVHTKHFLPFVEARALARSLGFESRADYKRNRPENLPWNPKRTYKGQWTGWGDFLGTGNVRTKHFLPFAQARALARSLEFKNRRDYHKGRPENLPSIPTRTYKGEWISWNDFLGTENVQPQIRRQQLLELIEELIPTIKALSPADVLQILDAKGTLPFLGRLFRNRPLSEILNALMAGEVRARVVQAPERDLRVRGPIRIAPEDGEFLQEGEVNAESVRMLDRLASLLDSQTIARLIDSQVSGLRAKYISGGEAAAKRILAGDGGGKLFKAIRDLFRVEIRGLKSVRVAEWKLRKLGHRVLPNAMQRLTAWKMTQQRTWGNWSGAGAGKTASAGLASYAVGSKLTVVLAANSTLLGWKKQLEDTFRGVQVYFAPDQVGRGTGAFLILNYEKFQRQDTALVKKIVKLHPDLVVLDEVQLIKHRENGTAQSLRRSALTSLLDSLPDARVLCMSATPVINTLVEGISILEIASGGQLPKLRHQPTVSNALSVYYQLLRNGLRYRPEYGQDLDIRPVTVKRNDLVDFLKQGRIDVLGLEQKLLLPKLQAVEGFLKPGTILYLEYVHGMASAAQQFVKSKGLSVAEYTGKASATDRESMEGRFISGEVDVLIGSRAISIGVDGLQKRCDRMIFLSLPWTHAAFEQTVGRVYRQGSNAAHVEIVIPQIIIEDYEGQSMSWDAARWNLIESKRTLAECACDGVIPNMTSLNRQEFLARAVDDLKALKVAITEGEAVSLLHG